MGYFSRCLYSEEDGLFIEEFHNPLQALFDAYPTLERMEIQMFEKLLGARVERSFTKVSGLTRYRFSLFPK
jgi:predicted ArsR family transcriptional regulator